MTWKSVAVLGSTLIIACGAPQANQVTTATQELTESGATPSVIEVLDAQLAAISSRDLVAATDVFAPKALFSGPRVDEVGLDDDAKSVASEHFEALYKTGFVAHTEPVRTIGGEDQATVRWAVYRFAVDRRPWTVSTLLSGPAPWKIVAQSWDRPEEDQAIMSKAQAGKMPPIGVFKDSLEDANKVIIDWIDSKRERPTEVKIHPPLRGDTFGLGSAGEYVQSDEAILVIQDRQREFLEAGHFRIDPMPGAGRLLRMSADGKAGAALYHVGLVVEGPEGTVTLPMRTISYFLLQDNEPRLVGGHFMATP